LVFFFAFFLPSFRLFIRFFCAFLPRRRM
jgi:hypothetical protein